MTDLTEQWKKGELLPDDLYWVKHDGIINILDNLEISLTDVEQVIAPVPSYEEWQASEKYNKHLEEVIKIYERKDKQATETSIAYNELAEENDKLKTENKWYSEQLNEAVKEIAQLKKWCEEFNALEVAKENTKLKSKLQLKETAYDFDTARLEEENSQLKERNDSLNNRDINLCRIANGIRDENFALKELLKECRNKWVCYKPYDRDQLLKRIDEALK